METEIEFFLPRGYLDNLGQLHRQGHMRLALALDEIEAISDPRVQQKESYLPVILLSRVITQLGSITEITPAVIEHLFATDLIYLQDLYLHINNAEQVQLGTICPICHTQFQVQMSPLG